MIFKDNFILLTLERRINGHHEWGSPAGYLNPGEHPLNGALREFYEETGYPLRENEIEITDEFAIDDTYFYIANLNNIIHLDYSIRSSGEIVTLCWIDIDTFLYALDTDTILECDNFKFKIRPSYRKIL